MGGYATVSMYYPLGINKGNGGVELELNGNIYSIESSLGSYLLFKPSEILHRGIAPITGERIAVEITLTPSISFDLTPTPAGQNARHPILPWQKTSKQSFTYHWKGDLVGLNIGGGPNWSCQGWINLEEVPSGINPCPFKIYPNSNFPFKDNSISNIYTSHAIEHLNIPTVYRLLSESYRVLKSEGNLIIKIPDYDKALSSWISNDYSFFQTGWAIETVTSTWGTKGVYDSLDYRASMIFCSFFNDSFGNPFNPLAEKNTKPYFGPAAISLGDLRKLIHNHTPSEITQELRKKVARLETNYNFCHQSAWSRKELQELLEKFGFEIVTFDSNIIENEFQGVTGISEMKQLSTYCWEKKRPFILKIKI